MSELIERLERTEGPDRELDADICRALGATVKRKEYFDGDFVHNVLNPPMASWQNVPHYTSSLDAALTLVPKDYRWQIVTHFRNHQAEITRVTQTSVGSGIQHHGGGAATHVSPAIALVIAALKARAVTGTQQGEG